jgi:spore germination protein KA
VVIVIAFTAVTGFVSPTLSDAASALRWILLLVAALFGSFGFVLAALYIFLHLTSLNSFGAPYMHPIAPFSPFESPDVVVRAPLRSMINRPSVLYPLDRIRKGTHNRASYKSPLPNNGDEP